MLITKQALPRRTFLRGMGATLALPLLDAMVPAMSARAPGAPRFAAVYVGNGMNMWDWTPPTEGVGFELSPILQPLERFRKQTLILSGLDNYPATDQGDTGGQHPRAAPAFMSSVHPKQTEGADVEAGTTVDQMIAELICRDSKLPSLEVSVDRNDVVGACDHGYACAYMNSLSWKTPTMPLPAETNPRFVFERLFGTGDTAEERQLRVEEDRSILDGLTREIAALSTRLGGHDRTKLGEYLDSIRDVEQRIARAESTNTDFAVPERPVGVPETFREYAELMFDLQVLAFQADITRVTSFMLARENINRSYNEIGPSRGAPLDVAPREQPEQDAGLHQAEHVPRRHADLLPGPAAGDPGRRRHAARRHRGPLRQRHERRQHPQQLQRACRRGGRAGARPAGEPPPSCIRRAPRWRTCRSA